jgi:hypothetical protein
MKVVAATESPPPEIEGDARAEKAARRKWMSAKEHRTGVKLPKGMNMGMEFCNGYLGTSTPLLHSHTDSSLPLSPLHRFSPPPFSPPSLSRTS